MILAFKENYEHVHPVLLNSQEPVKSNALVNFTFNHDGFVDEKYGSSFSDRLLIF